MAITLGIGISLRTLPLLGGLGAAITSAVAVATELVEDGQAMADLPQLAQLLDPANWTAEDGGAIQPITPTYTKIVSGVESPTTDVDVQDQNTSVRVEFTVASSLGSTRDVSLTYQVFPVASQATAGNLVLDYDLNTGLQTVPLTSLFEPVTPNANWTVPVDRSLSDAPAGVSIVGENLVSDTDVLGAQSNTIFTVTVTDVAFGVTRTAVKTVDLTAAINELIVADDGDGTTSITWDGVLDSITITGTTVHAGTYTTFADGSPLDSALMVGVAGQFLNVTPTTGGPNVGDVLTGGEALALYDSAQDEPVLSYQWLRDGVPISGADGQTYTVVEADAGLDITRRFVLTAVGLTTVTFDSNPISIVGQVVEDEFVTVSGASYLTGTTLPANQTSILVFCSVRMVGNNREILVSWNGAQGGIHTDFISGNNLTGVRIDSNALPVGGDVQGLETVPLGNRYHALIATHILPDGTHEMIVYQYDTAAGAWVEEYSAITGLPGESTSLDLGADNLRLLARSDNTAQQFAGELYRVALWTSATAGPIADITDPAVRDAFIANGTLAPIADAQTLLSGADRQVDMYGDATRYNAATNDGLLTLTSTENF